MKKVRLWKIRIRNSLDEKIKIFYIKTNSRTISLNKSCMRREFLDTLNHYLYLKKYRPLSLWIGQTPLPNILQIQNSLESLSKYKKSCNGSKWTIVVIQHQVVIHEFDTNQSILIYCWATLNWYFYIEQFLCVNGSVGKFLFPPARNSSSFTLDLRYHFRYHRFI